MSKQFRFLCGILPALLAAPAVASDWYVSASNGSDANGGTSPTDAWLTITHAVASTPGSGVQTIHIASGVYDAALGEHFPISMRPDLQLVGEPGGAKPRLVDVATYALIDFGSASANPGPFGPQTLIQGLELSSAGASIAMQSYTTSLSPTLRDLDVRDYHYTGITFLSGGGQSSHVTMDRVRVIRALASPGQAVGFDALTQLGSSLTVDAHDCVFRGGKTNVRIDGSVTLDFERCRIEGSSLNGLQATNRVTSTTRVHLTDCSISGSDNYGMKAEIDMAGVHTGILDVHLNRCTLADNGTGGLIAVNPAGGPSHFQLERCVLKNGFFDLAIPASSAVSDSLIADGLFTGSNGNFAADPLFVSSDDLDWRVRWDSPCIDRIADAAVAAGIDLNGHARGIDGDLDRVERSDIGAFEFQPLDLVSTGELGSNFELDSWGPQGNASIVYWTRTAPVAPIATPFGEFDLDLALTRVFRTTTVGATTPTQIIRHIPNNPLLLGQTYAFQALVDSPASPTGKAYTNAVAVTFVP